MTRRLKTTTNALMLAALLAAGPGILPATASASGRLGSGGGSGGGGSVPAVDTIKVSKAYYADTGSYVELLVMASSSNSTARLFVYLPDGQLLGEVPNGGGGRYGGTVFLSMYIPATLTFVSTGGGSIQVATDPFQF